MDIITRFVSLSLIIVDVLNVLIKWNLLKLWSNAWISDQKAQFETYVAFIYL